MNVSVRQLRAFVTIAQLGSFVEASRAMHVTPAALSIVIGELEQALGFRVFDRTTRRVRLSGAGEQYFPYAERVLADLASAERCAADLKNRKTGVVRVATTQAVAWALMPAAFAAFGRAHPQVRIEPVDVVLDEILPAVERGTADIALMLRAPAAPELEAVPVFTSRMHAALSPSHRWARRKSLRWSEIAGEPLIFTGSDTAARIHSQLPDGPVLNAAFEVGSTMSALALAASGMGIAVNSGFVRPLTRVHGLCMVPLASPAVVRSFMLYTHRTRSLSPAIDLFKRFLLDHFAAGTRTHVEDRLAPWTPAGASAG